MALKDANPLLDNFDLPKFSKIRPEHIEPAIDTVLQWCETELQRLESHPTPSWEGLVRPLQDMSRKVSAAWGPVSHLANVKNSDELRTAVNRTLPKVVQFSLRYSQSRPIYEGLKALREGPDWQHFESAQKRIIDKMMQDAVLSGIELEGEQRLRFNELSQRLSELATQFSNNVLDATKDFKLVVRAPESVKDVPIGFRDLWASNYNNLKPDGGTEVADADQGPWCITLDYASYEPFLRYCPDRALRETVYRANVTRASSGNFDNSENIKEILRLRQEKAQLLGYKTFAELSIQSKMAESVEKVDELLEDLRTASYDIAQQEVKELREFAASQGLKSEFCNWDQFYYSEKLRISQFDLSDEELRPYFPLPKVLGGLFSLVHRLFGITIKVDQREIDVWHPDVTYYDIYDEHDTKIAGFFLDPYSRPENKRGGAWMDTCIDRGFFDDKIYLPVAYLVCNATPPSKDKPAMLSFREVETLFHEFGHGLQHMLTKINESAASGINGVEWDAVELPSQFMENWCYHKPTLVGLTEHVESGQQLPDELFEKIIKARNFQSAIAMTRQLHFGMIDLELHHRYDPQSDIDIFAINQKIAKKVAAFQPLPEDRFLCAFSHIFAGGYAAGYYSYKWAEVLSADAFSRFEDEGLEDEDKIQKVGADFRDTVLSLGGSVHPMQVFKLFRGREPQVDALLRHSGIRTS